MARWPNLVFGALSIAVAAPAAADDMPKLPPVPQARILTGAQTCLGVTNDAAVDPVRFADWTPATAEQRKNMHAGGDVVLREDVMIAYKAGRDGGCVVMAQGDAAFEPKAFYDGLSAVVGAPISQSGKPDPVNLPNGELIIPVVSPPSPPSGAYVVLVFANREGKPAKKGK